MRSVLALLLALGSPPAEVGLLEATHGEFSYRAVTGAPEVRVFAGGREVDRFDVGCPTKDLAVQRDSLYVACDGVDVHRYTLAAGPSQPPRLAESYRAPAPIKELRFSDEVLDLDKSSGLGEEGSGVPTLVDLRWKAYGSVLEAGGGGFCLLLGTAALAIPSLARDHEDRQTTDAIAYSVGGTLVAAGLFLVPHGIWRWSKHTKLIRKYYPVASTSRTRSGTRTFNFGMRF